MRQAISVGRVTCGRNTTVYWTYDKRQKIKQQDAQSLIFERYEEQRLRGICRQQMKVESKKETKQYDKVTKHNK